MRKHVKNTTPKHFSGLPGEMGEFEIQNWRKNMKVGRFCGENHDFFCVLGQTQRLLGGAFNVSILFTLTQHSHGRFPINLAEQLYSSLILRTKSREGSLKPLLHRFRTY